MDAPVEQLARLYDEHVEAIYGFFRYRLGSRGDAAGLTELTFERALALGYHDPDRDGAGVWLLAIARELLVDYPAGHPGPVEQLGDDFAPEHEQAAGMPDGARDLGPDLEAALDRLDDYERDLVALRFGGDLNGPEIAWLTGFDLADVRQVLSRALRRLRYELAVGRRAESDTAVLPDGLP